MNDRRLHRLLADAIELLDRANPVLLPRLADMTEAQNGHPKSGALDSVGGRGKTTFCEVHGRERCACGGGTPFANQSDPTGEAAIIADRAAMDRRELERAVRSIAAQASEVVYMLARYTPRPATERERLASLADNDRDVPCWSCRRWEESKGQPKWEPASRTAEVAGERRPLCWWCFDWLRKGDGSPPSLVQVAQHHTTGRVRRPA